MPVKIEKNITAIKELEKEEIFAITDEEAAGQDIRPLRFAILNLMPDKYTTEKQLLRLISNTPLQIDVVFLYTDSYESKNTDNSYLKSNYKTINSVISANDKFDALIVTGAPVEHLDFERVKYWDELARLFKWARKSVYSSLFICWAAQAALYFYYDIEKKPLSKKILGIFEHEILEKNSPLFRGFDDKFFAPHSRHSETDAYGIEKADNLKVLAKSEEAGIHIASSLDYRQVFAFGHEEYDRETLHKEYTRDVAKGLDIDKPKNYYEKNVVGKIKPLNWRSSASLFFSNWINYCVYQNTPYNLERLD